MSLSRGPLKAGRIQTGVLAPAGTVSSTNLPVGTVGFAHLVQTGTIVQNSTTAVDYILYLDAGSQITSFQVDVLTAYDSATSATFSAGITSGGTEYVSGVDCKAAAGRIVPAYTGAQLLAMASTATTTQTANVNPYSKIFCTITVVGATTAGTVRVTVHYVQKDA